MNFELRPCITDIFIWRLLYVKAKRNVKHEDIYLKFARSKAEPTDSGRDQFFDFESQGIVPETPDPYYLRLSEGRKWVDWQRNEMKEQYFRFLNGDSDCGWWGWCQLREDWKGELHILRMLMSWHSFVPAWVYNEELEESII